MRFNAIKIMVLSLALITTSVGGGWQDTEDMRERMATWVKRGTRTGLRSVATDLSKCGLEEEVLVIHEALLDLGDDEEELSKMLAGWRKKLEKPKDSKKARDRAAKKLESRLKPLEDALEGASEKTAAETEHLAAVLLRLNSSNEVAQLTLGHKLTNGAWLSEEEISWKEGAGRVNELIKEARKLPVDVASGPSENAALKNLYEVAPHVVSANGVSLHGGFNSERLEVILKTALRAHALSRALLSGEELQLRSKDPQQDQHLQMVLLPGDETDYSNAKSEALKNKGRNEKDYVPEGGFYDKRGWETGKWVPEAEQTAWILHRLIEADKLMKGAPATIHAGHTNWICQRFLGTSIPVVIVSERNSSGEPGTTTKKRLRNEVLWLTASRSLFGCKTWMRAELLAGRRHLWSHSFLDQIGKIQDTKLLKTTLVIDFLQVLDGFPTFLKELREGQGLVADFEKALAASLPEFEETWARWLLGPSQGVGLLQRLRGAEGDESYEGNQDLLAFLEEIRKDACHNAYAATADYPHGFQVDLHQDPELSEMARIHASYLNTNPEQQTRWPDAHEEYPDKAGYSPEGAWAGAHSVIAFTPDPKRAVHQWMSTFYHRLPLTEPGLFGVGLGQEGNVTVLDVVSLVAPYRLDQWVVWPPPDYEDTPRSFLPELPNPVPGEDQSMWGYPVTIQVYSASEGSHNIHMELFEGEAVDGSQVPHHLLTPTSSYEKRLVPSHAYCLIPKAKLKPRTEYTVKADCHTSGESMTWNFTTGK